MLAPRWLREPLVHFVLLGAGLFVLYSLVGGVGDERSHRIEVSAAQVERLAELFARTYHRPPTARELRSVVDDHVRDEIYYREAIAMGLDRDDTIVRRRMRQKLEFFTDNLLAAIEPGEEELRAFLADHPERFRVEGRLGFQQIYFDRDRRGDAAVRDAESLLARLQAGGTDEPGDWLPLPESYDDVSTDEVRRSFGSAFAASLGDLPLGEWAGPIESGYGLHLVLLRERRPGEVPKLDQVRQAVEREWSGDRRAAAQEAFYQELHERYDVIVHAPESGTGDGGWAAEASR